MSLCNDNTKEMGLPIQPYGFPGSGLLPRSLTKVWASERLPEWVSKLAEFEVGSTFSAFDHYKLPLDNLKRERLCRFAEQLIRSRRLSLQDLQVIEPPTHAPQLSLKDIPWSNRTQNVLAREGLDKEFGRLSRLTFKDIFAMGGFGVRCALDFSVTLQSALDSNSVYSPDTRGINLTSNSRLLTSLDVESLRQIAGEPWASLVSAQDPRFQDLLLPLGNDTVADLVESVLCSWDTVDAKKTAISLLRSYPQLLERIARITTQKLEPQLLEIFHGIAKLENRRLNALLARFGWGGKPPITLEEAGTSIGITRERIRQLEAKIRDRLPLHAIFIPALQRAIAELETNAPIECVSAESMLINKHIVESNFSPQSVIAVASDLSQTTNLHVSRVGDSELVELGIGTAVKQILRQARRLCGSMGVCSASQICEEIEWDIDRSIHMKFCAKSDLSDADVYKAREQEVVHALSLTDEVQQLSDGWYWVRSIPPNRNRLINCTLRMLSVTERLSIKKIREGLRRLFQFRNSSGTSKIYLRVPGSEVLKNFFQAHPDFNVEANDFVTCRRVLDYRQELGPLEQTMVEIIRTSSSQLLDRSAFRIACLKRGLNPSSVELAITYSPIIERPDLNIWTLRGTDINPASLDAMRDANALRARGKRLHGYGWTPNGTIWVAARLSEVFQSFVLGSPGPMRRFLAGQKFKATGEAGASCGFIAATEDGSLYGFGTFLRLAGAEEGDIILMEFNLPTETVLLRLGDEELLDSYETGDAATELSANDDSH